MKCKCNKNIIKGNTPSTPSLYGGVGLRTHKAHGLIENYLKRKIYA